METAKETWTDLMGLGRDPWKRIWARRAITIPLYFVGLSASLAVSTGILAQTGQRMVVSSSGMLDNIMGIQLGYSQIAREIRRIRQG